MPDPRREGGRSPKTTGNRPEPEGRPDQEAAGTNRDFDESQESKNQGHGHPREEREKPPK